MKDINMNSHDLFKKLKESSMYCNAVAWDKVSRIDIDENDSDHFKFVYKDGSFYWFKNGRLHNEDGEAFYCDLDNGTKRKEWYRNGVLHRLDGPAILQNMSTTSLKYFYVDGKRCSPHLYNNQVSSFLLKEYSILSDIDRNNFVKNVKLKNINILDSSYISMGEKDNTILVVFLDEQFNLTKQYWSKDNYVLHRENDLPAVECKKYKMWFKDGLLHRENNPAIIYSDGQREFYKKGRLHCEFGPSIFKISNNKLYYDHFYHLNGVSYSEEEFLKRTQTADLKVEQAKNESSKDENVVTEDNGMAFPLIALAGGALLNKAISNNTTKSKLEQILESLIKKENPESSLDKEIQMHLTTEGTDDADKKRTKHRSS